jgi:hypothetical protein
LKTVLDRILESVVRMSDILWRRLTNEPRATVFVAIMPAKSVRVTK